MSIGCVLNISITKTVPFDTVSFYSGGADQARTDETVMVAGQVSLKKRKPPKNKDGSIYFWWS